VLELLDTLLVTDARLLTSTCGSLGEDAGGKYRPGLALGAGKRLFRLPADEGVLGGVVGSGEDFMTIARLSATCKK
jgi:hypothetical protein